MSDVHFNKISIKSAIIGLRCVFCGKFNHHKLNNLEGHSKDLIHLRRSVCCVFCGTTFEVDYSLEIRPHNYETIREGRLSGA